MAVSFVAVSPVTLVVTKAKSTNAVKVDDTLSQVRRMIHKMCLRLLLRILLISSLSLTHTHSWMPQLAEVETVAGLCDVRDKKNFTFDTITYACRSIELKRRKDDLDCFQ